MAQTATHFFDGKAILRALAAPFNALGNGMIVMAEANSRVRQADFLHTLSDAELAERGLRRDDIARHVFGNFYA